MLQIFIIVMKRSRISIQKFNRTEIVILREALRRRSELDEKVYHRATQDQTRTHEKRVIRRLDSSYCNYTERKSVVLKYNFNEDFLFFLFLWNRFSIIFIVAIMIICKVMIIVITFLALYIEYLCNYCFDFTVVCNFFRFRTFLYYQT